VVSPSTRLRTGPSNHERPFDRLRGNGINLFSEYKSVSRKLEKQGSPEHLRWAGLEPMLQSTPD